MRNRIHELTGAFKRRRDFRGQARRLIAEMARLLADAAAASALTHGEVARIRAQMLQAELQIAEGDYAAELALIELEAVLGTPLRRPPPPKR